MDRYIFEVKEGKDDPKSKAAKGDKGKKPSQERVIARLQVLGYFYWKFVLFMSSSYLLLKILKFNSLNHTL